MLKIFVTSFEICCAKIAFRVLSAHIFVFEEFLGCLRCEKNLTQVRHSESAKSGLLTQKCLNFEGFLTMINDFPQILAVEKLKTHCFAFFSEIILSRPVTRQ